MFAGHRNRIEILTSRERDQWLEALQEIGTHDFYHLPEMSRLAELEGEGEAVMLVYREAGHVAAFPMLLRRIEGFAGFDDLWDASSIYGYPGPITSPVLPEDVRARFLDVLGGFFRAGRVVTAFTRLHPLMEQCETLSGCGEATQIGVTISIDLTAPPEEQVARYRKSHRYEIARLRSQGFVARQGGTECLGEFIDIYHESMRDVGADPYYFFDRSYFEYLMNEMPGVMTLFVCEQEGETACAALFARCTSIVQYHLAGTKGKYRKLAPMKLLLDEARMWANSTGASVLHLGGGVGAKQDSLYAFKRGFSDREHAFSVWKHVISPALYEELCREAVRMSGRTPESLYFPFYRHPEFQKKEPDTAGLVTVGAEEEML